MTAIKAATPADGGAFVIARDLAAPPELVWQAFTECGRLMRWWGPAGFAMRECRLDLRPGGVFRYRLQAPDGTDIWGRFVYREVVAPERLGFIVSFTDEAGEVARHPFSPDWPLEVLSAVTFAGHGGGTRLTVRSAPHAATEAERRTFGPDTSPCGRAGPGRWTGSTGIWRRPEPPGAGFTNRGQREMTAERTKADVESEVRGLLHDWAEATRAKDIDGIMSHYAPDVLAFDCHSALQFKGRAAFRRHLEACLPAMRGPMIFEIHELDVMARDDIAFGHCVARCGGTGPDGSEHSAWLRVTVCLRRMDGGWLIVHDHCSAPFDPATTRALLDLGPQDTDRVAAA